MAQGRAAQAAASSLQAILLNFAGCPGPQSTLCRLEAARLAASRLSDGMYARSQDWGGQLSACSRGLPLHLRIARLIRDRLSSDVSKASFMCCNSDVIFGQHAMPKASGRSEGY